MCSYTTQRELHPNATVLTESLPLPCTTLCQCLCTVQSPTKLHTSDIYDYFKAGCIFYLF